MFRIKSSQKSVTELRKANEVRISKFLQKRAGPPPRGSLCPKHSLRSKKLCTSQNDLSLAHAGKWFSFCKACDRIYFSAPSVDVQDLVQNNAEFGALIEQRRALLPKQRQTSQSISLTAQAAEEKGPVVKLFIFWTKSGQSPTLIPSLCDCTKPIRLTDYRVLLEEKGIKHGQEIDVFNTAANAWEPLEWGAEYSCGEEKDIMLKYAGVDVTSFRMYHS